MDFLHLILATLWFFLPAYLANMAPIFAQRFGWWPSLAKPVDFGMRWRGHPLFGSHKTWRGFAVGFLWATLAVVFQYLSYEQYGFLRSISILPYDQYPLLLLGFLFGVGALFGDLAKSFIKRRVGIAAGEKFIPFDQIDYTLGSLLFLAPVFFPGIWIALTGILLNLFLHFLANGLGYALGLKEVWW